MMPQGGCSWERDRSVWGRQCWGCTSRERHTGTVFVLPCPESPRPGGKCSSHGRTEQPPARAPKLPQSSCRILRS